MLSIPIEIESSNEQFQDLPSDFQLLLFSPNCKSPNSLLIVALIYQKNQMLYASLYISHRQSRLVRIQPIITLFSSSKVDQFLVFNATKTKCQIILSTVENTIYLLNVTAIDDRPYLKYKNIFTHVLVNKHFPSFFLKDILLPYVAITYNDGVAALFLVGNTHIAIKNKLKINSLRNSMCMQLFNLHLIYSTMSIISIFSLESERLIYKKDFQSCLIQFLDISKDGILFLKFIDGFLLSADLGTELRFQQRSPKCSPELLPFSDGWQADKKYVFSLIESQSTLNARSQIQLHFDKSANLKDLLFVPIKSNVINSCLVYYTWDSIFFIDLRDNKTVKYDNFPEPTKIRYCHTLSTICFLSQTLFQTMIVNFSDEDVSTTLLNFTGVASLEKLSYLQKRERFGPPEYISKKSVLTLQQNVLDFYLRSWLDTFNEAISLDNYLEENHCGVSRYLSTISSMVSEIESAFNNKSQSSFHEIVFTTVHSHLINTFMCFYKFKNSQYIDEVNVQVMLCLSRLRSLHSEFKRLVNCDSFELLSHPSQVSFQTEHQIVSKKLQSWFSLTTSDIIDNATKSSTIAIAQGYLIETEDAKLGLLHFQRSAVKLTLQLLKNSRLNQAEDLLRRMNLSTETIFYKFLSRCFQCQFRELAFSQGLTLGMLDQNKIHAFQDITNKCPQIDIFNSSSSFDSWDNFDFSHFQSVSGIEIDKEKIYWELTASWLELGSLSSLQSLKVFYEVDNNVSKKISLFLKYNSVSHLESLIDNSNVPTLQKIDDLYRSSTAISYVKDFVAEKLAVNSTLFNENFFQLLKYSLRAGLTKINVHSPTEGIHILTEVLNYCLSDDCSLYHTLYAFLDLIDVSHTVYSDLQSQELRYMIEFYKMPLINGEEQFRLIIDQWRSNPFGAAKSSLPFALLSYSKFLSREELNELLAAAIEDSTKYPKARSALVKNNLPLSTCNLYQLLRNNIPYDVSKLFWWQSNNKLSDSDLLSMPTFELNISHSGALFPNFHYFLIKGRPSLAFTVFVIKYCSCDLKSQNKLFRRAIWQCKEIAFSNISEPNIVSACVIFFELLGVQSLLFRNQIQILRSVCQITSLQMTDFNSLHKHSNISIACSKLREEFEKSSEFSFQFLFKWKYYFFLVKEAIYNLEVEIFFVENFTLWLDILCFALKVCFTLEEFRTFLLHLKNSNTRDHLILAFTNFENFSKNIANSPSYLRSSFTNFSLDSHTMSFSDSFTDDQIEQIQKDTNIASLMYHLKKCTDNASACNAIVDHKRPFIFMCFLQGNDVNFEHFVNSFFLSCGSLPNKDDQNSVFRVVEGLKRCSSLEIVFDLPKCNYSDYPKFQSCMYHPDLVQSLSSHRLFLDYNERIFKTFVDDVSVLQQKTATLEEDLFQLLCVLIRSTEFPYLHNKYLTVFGQINTNPKFKLVYTINDTIIKAKEKWKFIDIIDNEEKICSFISATIIEMLKRGKVTLANDLLKICSAFDISTLEESILVHLYPLNIGLVNDLIDFRIYLWGELSKKFNHFDQNLLFSKINKYKLHLKEMLFLFKHVNSLNIDVSKKHDFHTNLLTKFLTQYENTGNLKEKFESGRNYCRFLRIPSFQFKFDVSLSDINDLISLQNSMNPIDIAVNELLAVFLDEGLLYSAYVVCKIKRHYDADVILLLISKILSEEVSTSTVLPILKQMNIVDENSISSLELQKYIGRNVKNGINVIRRFILDYKILRTIGRRPSAEEVFQSLHQSNCTELIRDYLSANILPEKITTNIMIQEMFEALHQDTRLPNESIELLLAILPNKRLASLKFADLANQYVRKSKYKLAIDLTANAYSCNVGSSVEIDALCDSLVSQLLCNDLFDYLVYLLQKVNNNPLRQRILNHLQEANKLDMIFLKTDRNEISSSLRQTIIEWACNSPDRLKLSSIFQKLGERRLQGICLKEIVDRDLVEIKNSFKECRPDDLRTRLENALECSVSAAKCFSDAYCYKQTTYCVSISRLIALQIILLHRRCIVGLTDVKDIENVCLHLQSVPQVLVIANAYEMLDLIVASLLWNRVVQMAESNVLTQLSSRIQLSEAILSNLSAKMNSESIKNRSDSLNLKRVLAEFPDRSVVNKIFPDVEL